MIGVLFMPGAAHASLCGASVELDTERKEREYRQRLQEPVNFSKLFEDTKTYAKKSKKGGRR